MTQNETGVSGDVVWQDGDDLSEANLTRTAAKSNLTDYVERGLGVSVDSGTNTVDIGSGHVIIQDGINAYDVFPNQLTGISLPGAGANYIYIALRPNGDDDVYYHIDEDQSPPSGPSLLIGIVDADAGTLELLNRDPDATFDQAALADRPSQPSALNGKRVLYVDESDGTIYKLNPDGTEEPLGGGGGIFEDIDGDGTYEQTTGSGIETPSVSTGDATVNNSVTWPDGSETVTSPGGQKEVALLGGTAGVNTVETLDTATFYDVEGGRVAYAEPMPGKRRAGTAFEHNGDIYYIGGIDNTDTVTDTVFKYSRDTGSWSTMTPMPTARGRLSRFTLLHDGIAYIFGGYDGSNRIATMEAYDIQNDAWDTSVTDAPATQTFPLHTIYGGYIWYVTGNTGTSTDTGGHVQRYDPAADSWDGPANFAKHPDNVTDGVGWGVGSEFHVFGGWDTKDGVNERSDRHAVYDLDTDTWATPERMPQAWTHGGLAHFGDEFYRMSGIKHLPNVQGAQGMSDGEVLAYNRDGGDYATYGHIPPRVNAAVVHLSKGAPVAYSDWTPEDRAAVEGWEQGEIPWYYTGDTGYASLVQERVHTGQHGLRMESDSTERGIYATDRTRPIRRGDRFEFWGNNISAVYAYLWFCMDPDSPRSDYYQIAVSPSSGNFRIQESSAGSKSTVAEDTTVSDLRDGRYWTVEAEFRADNTLKATLVDVEGTVLAEISGTPENIYVDGHIGFGVNSANSGEYVIIDSLNVLD